MRQDCSVSPTEYSSSAIYGTSNPLEEGQRGSSAIPLNFDSLKASSEIYEWLISKLHVAAAKGDRRGILQIAERAALCAASTHTGRFADGALENVVYATGLDLDERQGAECPSISSGARRESRRRVLHVLTQAVGVGGHTRMVYQWILRDKESCHSVILLSQENLPIPSWLSDVIHENGGSLVAVDAHIEIERRAMQLRHLARHHSDLVVLHHHSWDIVPTLALACRGCPPVAVLNHADHLFWMGSSIADIVINLRSPSCKHTEERRSIGVNTVLPVPLTDSANQRARADARKALSIKDDAIVLLSVGRAEKYRACGAFDFVSTANRILDRTPNAQMYVIGVSTAELEPYLRCRPHERLHLIGTIEDPSIYRAAADIYLESFPFGSQTALLEAALCGLPIVPAYAPMFPLLVAYDDSVHDIIQNPRDEAEYIERVQALVEDPKRRLAVGKRLRKRVLDKNAGEGWMDLLGEVYAKADCLSHRPRLIPATRCEITEADVALSIWHANSRSARAKICFNEPADTALWSAASLAKELKIYSLARRFALRVLFRNPARYRCWRLFISASLGGVVELKGRVSFWFNRLHAAPMQRAT